MQEKQIFILNKNVFSVAIIDGDNVLEKRFEKNQNEQILNYLLENGVEIIEDNNLFFLKGNFYVFGDNFCLSGEKNIKLKRWINCNTRFYIKSGFLKSTTINNLYPLYKKINLKEINSAKEVFLVWEYLQNKKDFSQIEKNNLLEDCEILLKQCCEGEYSFDFIWATLRICNNSKVLYGGEQEINYAGLKKFLQKILLISKYNQNKSKEPFYFDIIRSIEKVFLEKGNSILNLFKEDKLLVKELKKEFWDKCIKTAIFWVINDKKIICPMWIIKNSNTTLKELSKERVDCYLSHYEVWDRYKKNYMGSDFATFPRGRILYDTKNKYNIVFYDKCITKRQIKEIVDLLQINNYQEEYDEHYSCDNCVKDLGEL